MTPAATLRRGRHRFPTATIDPDRSLGWMRRLLPLVRAHRRAMVIGIVTGVVALVLQVAVPALARSAIDATRAGDRGDLRQWVVLLLVAGVGRFVFGAVYRYALFELAWSVETDLRALLYAHLTTLSFSYYDRTQSGQVISRANSDIRSIQVLLAFGPLVLMSVLAFVVAFGFMLSIHVPLTLVALSTLPGVYFFGQRLRNVAFPLTWVSQARMAEMATIVDENVNGTRVVKSFAAEQRQVDLLARSADHLRWANVEAIRARARYNPWVEALPRLGMALGAALRRPAGHRRRGHDRHPVRVQRVRHHVAGAVPHVRLPAPAEPTCRRLGRARLRGPRHRARRA